MRRPVENKRTPAETSEMRVSSSLHPRGPRLGPLWDTEGPQRPVSKRSIPVTLDTHPVCFPLDVAWAPGR